MIKEFRVRTKQEQHKHVRWKLRFVPTIKPRGSKRRWYAYVHSAKRVLVIAKDKLHGFWTKKGKAKRWKTSDEVLMGIIVHEIVHAVDIDIPEQTVLNIEAAVAETLTRLGFRRFE